MICWTVSSCCHNIYAWRPTEARPLFVQLMYYLKSEKCCTIPHSLQMYCVKRKLQKQNITLCPPFLPVRFGTVGRQVPRRCSLPKHWRQCCSGLWKTQITLNYESRKYVYLTLRVVWSSQLAIRSGKGSRTLCQNSQHLWLQVKLTAAIPRQPRWKLPSQANRLQSKQRGWSPLLSLGSPLLQCWRLPTSLCSANTQTLQWLTRVDFWRHSNGLLTRVNSDIISVIISTVF